MGLSCGELIPKKMGKAEGEKIDSFYRRRRKKILLSKGCWSSEENREKYRPGIE